MVVSENKKIDHLTEDDPIPRQNFVCLSFVSPEGVRNCSMRALKVRGVYETRQEADDRCTELQLKDSDFDIFVGEVGKWCPWDPDPNTAKDQKYQEAELQNLVEGYKDNLNRATQVQEDRKKQMIQNAARDEQDRATKQKVRMRKKLEQRKADERMENTAAAKMENMLPQNIETHKKTGGKKLKDDVVDDVLDDKNESAKSEKQRLHENQTNINSQNNKVESIDSKLDRIQSLYNKLKEKETTTN
jgi:hypothetical protein